MPEEVRLWHIHDGDSLTELKQSPLQLEARLEDWLERDIGILSADLLVIGRQVETDFGGFIDLLCMDCSGDLVIVELKRDKTSREVTAQALDYAAWTEVLSSERVIAVADRHLGADGPLDQAFPRKFGQELPETLNGAHRMMIVASVIDPSSERIIRYLSEKYGVNINAARFHYFRAAGGDEFLTRIFLIEPSEVEYQSKTRGGSKRRPPLTYEDLQETAETNGVGPLYSNFIEGLGDFFGRYTTRSSIAFTGDFSGGRKVVLSLLPQESSPANGLRYQVYAQRLESLFGMAEGTAVTFLPKTHEAWEYPGASGPEWSGFTGFFTSEIEVERFLALFRDLKVAESS